MLNSKKNIFYLFSRNVLNIIFSLLKYVVSSSSVPIDTTLNRFITINAGLTGTKSMCLEGGCGACIVAVKAKHPVDNKIRTWAVNSVID